LEKFIELNGMNPSPQVEEAWAMIFDLKMIIINQDSQDFKLKKRPTKFEIH